MPSLDDSLRRARREYDLAIERGDDEAAGLIERAIVVLEDAREGRLIPEQRPPSD